MTKDIFILGSTGSIGETTLRVIKKDKSNFNVKLLSTNKNVDKIYKQAVQFNVKKVVIFNKKSYFYDKSNLIQQRTNLTNHSKKKTPYISGSFIFTF